MTGDDETPTIGLIYSEQMVERFGATGRRGDDVTRCNATSPRRFSACSRR